jgi:hypothetical protein
VQWAIDLRTGRLSGGGCGGQALGCLGSLSTLGVGGAGVSLKLSCQGVACPAGGAGQGKRRLEFGCGGGIQAGLGESVGVGVGGCIIATLGASWLCTLGNPGVRQWDGQRIGGARTRHDSKMSQRLAMALTWEILVGGATPERAPVTTCNPWMILSSVEGEGTARYPWQNSTISKISWLLVSTLTSLKQR